MGIDQLGLNLEGLYKTIRLSAPGHDVSPTIGPKQTRAINASPSGDIMSTTSSDSNSQWDEVLSSAARLQTILPQAVLVGGTAASIYAHHRQSTDDDHVLTDLKQNFDEILAQLESVAGWTTARVKRPVQILGSLDGIETGIRQLIRQEPLETTTINIGKNQITVPTEAEILLQIG